MERNRTEPSGEDPLGRALVATGIVGFSMLLVVSTADGATRSDGYDAVRHWISLLSHGERGWLGTANLGISGALLLASAVGFLRIARRSATGTGVARAVAVLGGALLAASAFSMDPTNSYPFGSSAPGFVSLSGRIHAVAGVAIIGSCAAMCLAGARAFERSGRRRRAGISRWFGWVVIGTSAACTSLTAVSPSGTWEAAAAGAFQRIALFASGAWLVWFTTWSLRAQRPVRSRDPVGQTCGR
jgi:hypothetical protein